MQKHIHSLSGAKMIKSLGFFLLSVIFITSVHAGLLTESDMKKFMEDNKESIADLQAIHGIHKGYCVVRLAEQKMAEINISEQNFIKYKNVILSALSGIGFGGISKTKKASSKECYLASMALYTIGINCEKLTQDSMVPYTDGMLTTHKQHVEACNDLIVLANKIRGNKVLNENHPSQEARIFANYINKLSEQCNNGFIQEYESYKANDFDIAGKVAQQHLFGEEIELDFDQSADVLLGNVYAFGDISCAELLKEFNRFVQTAFGKKYSDLLLLSSLDFSTKQFVQKKLMAALYYVGDESSSMKKLINPIIYNEYVPPSLQFKRELRNELDKTILIALQKSKPNKIKYSSSIRERAPDLIRLLKDVEYCLLGWTETESILKIVEGELSENN